MNFMDTWNIFQRAVEASHKVWSYFSTVSLAVTGYIVAWDKPRWSWAMYAVVAAAYWLFALGNRKGVVNSQRDIVAASCLVTAHQNSLPHDAVERNFEVSCVPASQVYWFHVICTGAVIAAIAVTWWSRRFA